jgi:hypothetical protein
MVCHAFINGLWNVVQIGSRLGNWSEPSVGILMGVAAVILACFAVSVWLVARRQESSEPGEPGLSEKAPVQEYAAVNC